MSTMQKAMIAGFTGAERDYIRRELDQFFSTCRRWPTAYCSRPGAAGPQAGQPKVLLPALGDKLVWVNTRSGVYHFQGERYFGSTKQGYP